MVGSLSRELPHERNKLLDSSGRVEWRGRVGQSVERIVQEGHGEPSTFLPALMVFSRVG